MRKSYIWTVVALLWVVALLNYLDRQVIFSVLPLAARALMGVSETCYLPAVAVGK